MIAQGEVKRKPGDGVDQSIPSRLQPATQPFIARAKQQVLRFAQNDSLCRMTGTSTEWLYHAVNKCPIFSFFVRR